MGQQTSVEAYNAYLKGRFHILKLNPEDLARGQKSIEEAIALDPNYAPARTWLARAHHSSISIAFKPVREAAPLAKAAAQRALELNEMDPGVHALLGVIAAQLDFDWKEAMRQCQLALSCGPLSPEDRATCVPAILGPLRRFEDAMAIVQPAIAADPLSPLPRLALSMALIGLGSYDRAIEEIRRVLELQENFWVAYAVLGSAYFGLGNVQEMIAAHEKAVQFAPWNAPLVGGLAGSYALAGQRERGEKVLEALAAVPHPAARGLGYGVFYALIGELDRAADAMELAIEARHPVVVSMSYSPFFAEFRKHPRGQALLAKMNLADAAASGA